MNGDPELVAMGAVYQALDALGDLNAVDGEIWLQNAWDDHNWIFVRLICEHRYHCRGCR